MWHGGAQQISPIIKKFIGALQVKTTGIPGNSKMAY